MESITPRSRAAGFGLAEALVALLLLAIATVGAGTAMVRSLGAQRAALLRTQAADLAADLAEALRSAPDAAAQAAEIRAWEAKVRLILPRAEPLVLRLSPPRSSEPLALPAAFHIRVQWRDGRVPSPSLLTLAVATDASQERS